MKCPGCGADTLPHTRVCFDCGVAARTKPPVSARLEVSAVPATGSAALTAMLTELVAEPKDIVAALVGQRDRFEIAGTLGEDQWDRLGGWVAALGARQQRESRFVAGPELTMSWSWEGHCRPKLVLAALVGAAAVWFSVPLVPFAAALTAAVLFARCLQLLPVAMTLRPPVGEEKLEILDPALADDLARTRKTLATPALVEALRTIMVRATEVLALLRAEGGHLVDRELRVVDHRLQQLLRHSFRIAVSVDRLSQVAPRAEPGQGQADRMVRVAATESQALGTLDALAHSLDDLKSHMIDLHRAEARRALVSGPLRQLWELEGQLAGAAAIAEI